MYNWNKLMNFCFYIKIFLHKKQTFLIIPEKLLMPWVLNKFSIFNNNPSFLAIFRTLEVKYYYFKYI